MIDQTIYEDQFIRIFTQSNDVLVESFRPGLAPEKVNKIISSFPQIKITSFNCIKDALINAPKPPQKFGELKEKIAISISQDGLKAMVTFNCSKEELDFKNRESLVRETYSKLKEKHISHGIKRELFFSELECGKTYVIAEGTPAINGKDCVIKMYNLEEPKPQIKEDGKVDYYELKLINKVKPGDWLGERINATDGVPGVSVYGTPIVPPKGKNFPLLYDKNTVYEVEEGNKVVLYSKIGGAVTYSNGKITVSNYLEIDGDVDFKTGNINFDGYVSIKGTVTDGFSVEATKDIEINGDLGVGNVKSIKSHEGSIFIKGGIASKNVAKIHAGKNVFIKFLDNVHLTCSGIAHVGFYCINSIVHAKEVFIESIKGKIIGGRIYADVKVTTAVLGSQLEKKTEIIVKGFDRSIVSEQIEELLEKRKDLLDEQQHLKRLLADYNSKEQPTKKDDQAYGKNLQRFAVLREKIKSIDKERKNLLRYLRAKGDGEVNVTQKIYPNCSITIKGKKIDIKKPYLAAIFFVMEGELRKL
ncbi:MAG TPA: FapA family protein [Acetivibrio sp.]|nr:FapA family protein [Acetivibrio sp.]